MRIAVDFDGTIVKANSNNFRVIKIEEIEFLQNLIVDYDTESMTLLKLRPTSSH